MGRRALPLLILLLVLGAGEAVGQEAARDTTRPDTTAQDTARQDTALQDTAVQDTARQDTAVQDTTRQDTAVQDTVRPPPARRWEPAAFALAITVGTPGGGELQNQPVLAYRRNLAGAALDSAVINRTVTYQGGTAARVSGEVRLGPAWVVRLGAGFVTATLETSYSGDAALFVQSARAVNTGQAELAELSVESALRYRIPSQRQVQPYLEVGAVYSRWTLEGSLPEVAAFGTEVNRFEALAGLGGVIPLTRFFSVRLHVSTRVFRNPVAPVAAGDTVLTSSTLALAAQPPQGTTFADTRRETVGLLRLEVGLSLDLGRPAPAPPRQEAAPDTTSPPDRSGGRER